MSELADRRRDLDAAQHRYEKELKKVRKTCEHWALVECDYEPPGLLGSAMEPLRLCVECGAEEEGWGAGWQVLRDKKGREILPVSRNNLYGYRKGDRYLVSWCYGDKDHAPHACAVADLTKGHGTRCKDYEGFFDK